LENSTLKEQLVEMEQRAHYDELTKVANRRYFIESLEHRIMRCERYGDTSALLFLDVDNLKTINDTYGHGAGDALLVCLSQILLANVRASDFVARIGGDEFALLLDKLDADEVDSKIAFLMERIGQTHIEHEGQALPLSAAIGYCFVGPKDNVAGLLSRADAAMYQAKKVSINGLSD
jgi:diguanylate cyclase (GGDEF)-like protein